MSTKQNKTQLYCVLGVLVHAPTHTAQVHVSSSCIQLWSRDLTDTGSHSQPLQAMLYGTGPLGQAHTHSGSIKQVEIWKKDRGEKSESKIIYCIYEA